MYNNLIKFTPKHSHININIAHHHRLKPDNKSQYDLDFRLDSKYTTQIYPLIIHPLNRFYDIDSYYMAELSDICIQSQGFSDIKNNLVSK